MKYWIHNRVRALLERIAERHPANQTPERQLYPQLWYAWRWKRKTLRRRFVMRVCGLLSGHEMSATEMGYGGGKFMEGNCRWCDKVIQYPVCEGDPSPELKELMDSFRDGTLTSEDEP